MVVRARGSDQQSPTDRALARGPSPSNLLGPMARCTVKHPLGPPGSGKVGCVDDVVSATTIGACAGWHPRLRFLGHRNTAHVPPEEQLLSL